MIISDTTIVYNTITDVLNNSKSKYLFNIFFPTSLKYEQKYKECSITWKYFFDFGPKNWL